MKYPRVEVLLLPDNSFFISVPLFGKEMRSFEKELLLLFRNRGEDTSKTKKEGMSFFVALTELGSEELKNLSNQIIRKILKGGRDEDRALQKEEIHSGDKRRMDSRIVALRARSEGPF